MVDEFVEENASGVRLVSERAKRNYRYLIETGGRQFIVYGVNQLDALRKFDGCGIPEVKGLSVSVKVDRSPVVRSNTGDIDKRTSF